MDTQGLSERFSGYSQSGLYTYRFPSHGPDNTNQLIPVLMIHGSMDRGTSFNRLHNCLDGFATVTYDRRGYHRSRLAGQDHPADFHSQVIDALEILPDGRAVVVGHSYGATIALALAYEFPDLVRQVVAFEPPLLWRPWWPRPTARPENSDVSPQDVAEIFIRRMIGDARWEKLPKRTKEERRSEGPTFVLEISQLRQGPAPFETSKFQVPITIVRGSRTFPHQIRGTDELHDEIAGSKLFEIPGAGHGAHLSHPQQLAGLIKDVLEPG